MRHLSLAALLGGLLLASSGAGAPLERREPERIPVRGYFVQSLTEAFAGHQRTSAIVIGNGKTFLGLYVFDSHGNCVGLDDFPNQSTKDDLVVEWYPSAAGVYGIDIHNFGGVLNKAEVAFP